jgi:tellurite resistance protein TerC
MNGDHPVRHVLRWSRRIGIAIVGGAVVLVGVLMIVAPGPAFVVIPLGLGILSLEFEAPRRWLVVFRRKATEVAAKARDQVRKRRAP